MCGFIIGFVALLLTLAVLGAIFRLVLIALIVIVALILVRYIMRDTDLGARQIVIGAIGSISLIAAIMNFILYDYPQYIPFLVIAFVFGITAFVLGQGERRGGVAYLGAIFGAFGCITMAISTLLHLL